MQQTKIAESKNNLDLIRLILAVSVCFLHSNEILQATQDTSSRGVTETVLAVKCFFAISGFLILASFERSDSFASYFKKRIRRIYPAYAFVVIFWSVLLCAVSTLPISHYFSTIWVKYVLSNLLFINFIQPTLPGVFELNRFPWINASLWTIKVELFLYLTVPVLDFLCQKITKPATLTFCYTTTAALSLALRHLGTVQNSWVYAEVSREITEPLTYFIAGAFFYSYKSLFDKHIGKVGLLGCAILILDHWRPLYFLAPLAITAVLVSLSFSTYLGNFGKYGDFSYGIYLLHFPIAQLAASHNILTTNPILFTGLVTTISFIGAIAMWHLIEKRFLKPNSYYLTTRHPCISG